MTYSKDSMITMFHCIALHQTVLYYPRVNPFTKSNPSPTQFRARVKRSSRVKKDEIE
jgi:hypothetical protein